jgi:predicted alpha/beta hydrolase family esterase
MRNALILHGKPSRERYENPNIPRPHEANWLPWLGAELGKRGVMVTIPAFPNPYSPDYEMWSSRFEESKVTGQTTIVGHSAGAEFALRWLSEHDQVYVDKLALVAPWRDAKAKYGEFSQYDLDTELPKRIGRISIFNSLDDTTSIQERVASLRDTFPRARYVEFEDHGHFMLDNNMPTVEFPELLDELVQE